MRGSEYLRAYRNRRVIWTLTPALVILTESRTKTCHIRWQSFAGTQCFVLAFSTEDHVALRPVSKVSSMQKRPFSPPEF